MSIQIHVIPILNDNYTFVISDKSRGQAAVVDPGEFSKVHTFLSQQNLTLTHIIITHHHSDHIGGVSQLVNKYQPKVYAPRELHQHTDIEFLSVQQNDIFDLFEQKVKVLGVEGHTLGHVAYEISSLNSIFVGDVLFGLGCGRIFEGDYEMTFNSINKIKRLSENYKVYCAHEYTKINIEFVEKLLNENMGCACPNRQDFKNYIEEYQTKMQLYGRSVPLSLKSELKVNPFLLVKTCDQFEKIRKLRNKF
jgi:hydroxyacylglutathione hydrolase